MSARDWFDDEQLGRFDEVKETKRNKLQITIKNVFLETVKKPKGQYQVANVTYDQDGQTKQKKIMSFSNPAVFKQVADWATDMPTEPVNVTLTKDDNDYWQWAKIEVGGVSATPSDRPTGSQAAVKTTSNYETREERARRQVLIVKQSSLAQAVEFLGNTQDKGDYGLDNVLAAAQAFTDWVVDIGEDDAAE